MLRKAGYQLLMELGDNTFEQLLSLVLEPTIHVLGVRKLGEVMILLGPNGRDYAKTFLMLSWSYHLILEGNG
jgi:hypothetical protein